MGLYPKKHISFIFPLIFVGLTVCILTGGSLIYHNYKSNYRLEVEHQLASISELKINQLVQWRKERLGDAHVFYQNAAFSSLVQRYFSNPNDINAKKRILTWFEQVTTAYQYNRICLHDTKGVERLSFPVEVVLPSSVFEKRSHEVLSTKTIAFQDFYRDETDQHIYLSIIIPILDTARGNRILGIVAMRLDPIIHLADIIQRWPIPSKTSETMLVRQEGDEIVYLSELRFRENTVLNLWITEKGQNSNWENFLSNRSNIIEGLDYRGAPVIAFVHRIPDSPWFLVTKIDKKEAFKPIQDRLWITIFLMGALLLGTAGVLGLIWRRQEKNFSREQIESAEALRTSERKFQETLVNLDEGYYSVSMDGILLQHNQAFNRILGFDRSVDLKGTQLPDFWQHPEERQDYLQELKSRGFISKYPINAKTQAGNPITVIASSHLVKDSNQHPLRIEGVFLDITERMRAEESLRESEQRLRSTMDNMLEGCQIIDKEWRYQYLNKSAELQSRLPAGKLLGQKFTEIWPGIETTDLYKTMKRCMKERKSFHFDNEFTFLDGENGWFELSIQPVPEGVFILSMDITERIRTEQELRENARRLKEAQEMAHLGFWDWDVKTGSVEWSDEVYKIFNRDPKSFTPQIDSILALSPWPEDHERDKELINRAIESHQPGDYEQKFLRPDQSIGYYYSTFHGNYDQNGKLVSIVGTVLDITERKIAEEKLIHLMNRQEAILSAVPDILMEVDTEKRYIWANQAGIDFFGEDVIGRKASYYFEGEQITYTIVKPLFEGDENIIRVESWQRRKDGTKRLLSWLCRVLKDENGNVAGVISSARDITEKKYAEELLIESENKFRNVFDNSAIAKSITSLDGMIHVNQAFCDMLGYENKELLQQKWQDISHPDDIKMTQQKLEELSTGKAKSIHLIKRYFKKDGGIVWAEVNTVLQRDQQGHPQYYITSAVDITARKEAEEKILQSEAQLKEAQRIGHLGSWDLDLVNNKLNWSDEIYNIFEVDPENFHPSYESFLKRIHPEDREKVNSVYQNSIETKAPYAIEHRLMMTDGRIKHVREECETAYDAKGAPLRSLGIIQDITERKEIEERVRNLNVELEQRVRERTAQLEAANKELEAFSYSVSHDLRSPLRHIAGYVDLLTSRCRDSLSEKGLHYLDTILDSVQQMDILIEHLLKFSRTGRMAMHQSPLDMNQLIQTIKKSISTDNPDRIIEWHIGNLPTVICDPIMINQVWMNLLNNAVKFTQNRKKAKVEVGSREENQQIVFFVRDNGVGFHMKYAKKLFGVFQRLHSTDDFEGTGIGLANVQRIISRHGGIAWAEAEPNKGATFYFSLPLNERRNDDS